MSRASERAAARGERWYTVPRRTAMAKAFEAGMRLLDDPRAKQRIIDGEEPNWEGMAVLARAEKEKVRRDVKAFALAHREVARQAFEERLKPPKKGFVEKVREFFRA